MTDFPHRLLTLQKALKQACFDNRLAASNVTLLAASKGQGLAQIEEAIALGVTDFGENRVQEALEKWPTLKIAYPHVRLHLIGALQTNKITDAINLFDIIQTIDRKKLADELKKYCPDKMFYIQINTGHEPQKSGIAPNEADNFINYCQSLKLSVIGLMCVPPANQPASPHFALLRQIAERHNLKNISMGMSNDFETAIRMGATCVRIGTALFGEPIKN